MYAERKLGVIAFAAVYRRATREGTNRTLSCLTHTHTEELWVMSRMSMSHGRCVVMAGVYHSSRTYLCNCSMSRV